MKKIKILHLLPKLEMGGIENQIKSWYKKNNNEVYKFCFLVFEESGGSYEYFKNKGEEIYLVKRKKKTISMKFLIRIYKSIKKINPEIIHLPSSPTFILILILSKIAKVKIRICHAHTNYYKIEEKKVFGVFLLSLFRKLVNLFSTKLVACSREAGDYCFGKKKNYELVLNGIKIQDFYFNMKYRNQLRKKLKLESKIVIGSIGRLADQKNYPFLIEITRFLIKNNCKFHLLIIGDGAEKSKLIKKIDQNKMNENVTLIKSSKEIYKYYNVMDLFVLPSKYEGLGIVFIESQVNGLVSIASNKVPLSVKISPLIKFLDLNKSALWWSKKIIKYDLSLKRDKYRKYINQSGYNREETSLKMLDIYNIEYNRKWNKYEKNI